MSDNEWAFLAFLKLLFFGAAIGLFALMMHSCVQEDSAKCREAMAVTHSLRDSLVIADVSGVTCSNMVKDSLVARAKRQP